MINKRILYFFLLTIFCFSCSDKKKDTNNIAQLRKQTHIFFDYDKSPDLVTYKNTIDSLYQKSHTKPLAKLKNSFEIVLDSTLDSSKKIAKFDAILTNPEFKTYPNYYKFLTRVFLFLVYRNTDNQINSISQLKMCIFTLQSEKEKYYEEITLLNLALGVHNFHWGGDLETTLGTISIDKIDLNRLNKNIKFSEENFYNLSLKEFEVKNYESALKLVNKAIEIGKKNNDDPQHLAFDYTLKFTILASLKRKDQINEVINQVEHLYQTNYFSKDSYDQFYADSLLDLFDLKYDSIFHHQIQRLKNTVPNNCENQYLLTLIHNSEAKYFKSINDLVKEKMALQKGFKFAICNSALNNNIYYRVTQEKFLKKLIHTDSLQQNYKDLTVWYQKLDSTNQKTSELKNLNSDDIESNLKKEVQISSLLHNYYESNMRFLRKNLSIIFVLSIILFATLVVLFIQRKDRIHKNKLISVKNAKLELLNDKLERSNQNLSVYNKVIAHDIKMPLNTIVAFSKRIKNSHTDSLEPSVYKLLEIIINSGKNLTNMMNNLLEFTEVSIRPDKLEKVDILKVTQNIQFMLASKTQDQVQFIVSKKIPAVYGISTLIEQVFMNLISNAIKFKKPGTVCLIEIYPAQKSDNMITIAIKDNGIGIDKKHHQHIFEFARKLHASVKYEGSGIGLSTVKKIINGHGGDIWVESIPPNGTTFYFTLPLYEKKEQNFVKLLSVESELVE